MFKEEEVSKKTDFLKKIMENEAKTEFRSHLQLHDFS